METTANRYRAFADLPATPPEVRIPGWLPAVLIVAIAVAAFFGSAGDDEPLARFARGGLFASMTAYMGVSLLDLYEHFRIEKLATGRFLSWRVVPVGETIVHLGVLASINLMFLLARPLPASLEARDWIFLVSPISFLAFGWSDEISFHRRRSVHREDVLHAVSHIAAATMVAMMFVGIIAAR